MVAFDPHFLIYLLICAALSVFFLLYLNRAFASIVTYAIRAYSWHKFRVWIDIQALQISFLGGRIFFTGLRYHGSNETFLIQQGHVTWCYWRRRVRQPAVLSAADGENAGGRASENDRPGISDEKLPCRIVVSLKGVEWFIYNRTAAYDSVLAGLVAGANHGAGGGGSPEVNCEKEEEEGAETRAPAPAQTLWSRGSGPTAEPGSDPVAGSRGATTGPVEQDKAKKKKGSPVSAGQAGHAVGSDSENDDTGSSDDPKPGLPLFLHLLPIRVDCSKAAVVMGNENTTGILIAKSDFIEAEADAVASPTGSDPYRQTFQIRCQKPVIEIKDNTEFREDQATRATRATRENETSQRPAPPRVPSPRRRGTTRWPVYRKSFIHRPPRPILDWIGKLVPSRWRRPSVPPVDPDFSTARPGTAPSVAASAIPGHSRWQGLSRYLTETEEDDKTRWAAVEYAAESTIADISEAAITVYWDVPGKVGGHGLGSEDNGDNSHRGSNSNHENSSNRENNNINGGARPPAWGIDVVIQRGSVNYGPWADRHRADLQRVFFPSLCKDATPARPLRAGMDRVATKMKIYIQLDEEVIVRIPMREESKNWRHRAKGPHPSSKQQQHQQQQHGQGQPGQQQPGQQGQQQQQGSSSRRRHRSRPNKAAAAAAAAAGDAVTQKRPAGWLDLMVAPNSTVTYTMDMLPGHDGYHNSLAVDLVGTESHSSVNHAVLWRSGPLTVACDLSTPLRWNGLRTWRFDIGSSGLELFLLRDHIFLLTDLVNDWSSGPPPDYLVYTPFRYVVSFELRNLVLLLNINDGNIIDNPTSLDDNAFLVLKSPVLAANVTLPLNRFQPGRNAIPFEVRAEILTVSLNAPQWNTQASFLSSSGLGQLEGLAVEGSYHFHAGTGPANTDTLPLTVSAQSAVIYLYGFLLRYLIQLKDNYFGEHVHFKTLEEYQKMLLVREQDPAAELASRPPVKKSNDMDVMLNLSIDDLRILIPANVYSARRHIQLETPTLAIDLRLTNYYMDLDLDLAPISLSYGSNGGGADSGLDTPGQSVAGTTQLFVDGVHVYANRLFGSPRETTYLCSWDVSVGAVTGECTAEFALGLTRGAAAIGLTFDDEENALVPYSSIVFYDVTFARIAITSVRLWLHAAEAAFLFSTGRIEVEYNDWARSHYSKRADVTVPDLQVSCVNAEAAAAARHLRSRPHAAPAPVDAEAFLRTSIRLSMVGRKSGFSRERRRQQDLVRREDRRTGRAPFLLLDPRLIVLSNDDGEDVGPDADADADAAAAAADADRLAAEVFDPPAQSIPPIPHPVEAEEADADSIISSGTRRRSRIRRRSSPSSSSSSRARPGPDQDLAPASSSSPYRLSQPMFLLRAESGFSRRRDRSASTGHHSAFYSAVGDHRESVHHTSIAFSSQYFPPYFPLENVQPDPPIGCPGMDNDAGTGAAEKHCAAGLADIDPRSLSEDHASSSLLVEFIGGITACLDPAALRHLAALAAALQPAEPEAMLDRLQVDSMSEIADLKKLPQAGGQVREFSVRLPRASLRLLSSVPDESADADRLEGWHRRRRQDQDQYDVIVADVFLLSRTVTDWRDPFKPETYRSRVARHLRAGSCEASVARPILTDDDETRAAVTAQIGDVTVAATMGSEQPTSIEVEITAATISTASGEIDHVIGLVDRARALAAELDAVFSGMERRQRRRIQLVTYRLLTDHRRMADPTFVIRPSAVLRSAPRHLRTFDSWKLAMRLRHIWSSAGPAYRESLTAECECDHGDDGPDAGTAADEVLAALNAWRSWDLDNVRGSVLLQRVFGSLLRPQKQQQQPEGSEDRDDEAGDRRHDGPNGPSPLRATLKLAEFQLLIDPGPKQNSIGLGDLDVRFTRGQSMADKEKMTEVGGNQALMMVSVSCGRAGVCLNWDMCDLVKDVLRLWKPSRPQSPPSPQSPRSPPSPSPLDTVNPSRPSEAIHVVLVLAEGTIDIETVNLSARSRCVGLRTSLLLQDGSGNPSTTNFVMGFDDLTSRLHSSRAQPLATLQLHDASVFLSHVHAHGQGLATDGGPAHIHTIRSTAASRSVVLTVKQDPVGLLEVVDAVVRDEAAQLLRLGAAIAPPADAARPSRESGDSNSNGLRENDKDTMASQQSTVRVSAAAFLDGYEITIPLLERSLTYRISGSVARAAVAAADADQDLIFDFDVKENAHEMQVMVEGRPRSVSLLRIPPTNGRVVHSISGGGPGATKPERAITVFSAIEPIRLDASAVYTLLRALNRPQISSTVHEVGAQIAVIQAHVREISAGDQRDHAGRGRDQEYEEEDDEQDEQNQDKDGEEAAPSAVLVYNLYITMEGLAVDGNTPLRSGGRDAQAHLSFALDRVQVRVSNRHEPNGPALVRPDLHVHLHRVGFEVRRGRTLETMRSCGSVAFGATIRALSGSDRQCEEEAREDERSGGGQVRQFHFASDGCLVCLSPETVSTLVDALGYMGDKIKDIDTSRERHYLRRLRHSSRPPPVLLPAPASTATQHGGDHDDHGDESDGNDDFLDSFLSQVGYQFAVRDVRIRWLVAGEDEDEDEDPGKEDLILSVELIEFGTRTKRSARLTVCNFRLQMVPPGQELPVTAPVTTSASSSSPTSHHSATLPEVIFNVAHHVSPTGARRLAFQAVGKSLDLRLTSGFIVPAAHLRESLTRSLHNVRQASQNWATTTTTTAAAAAPTIAPTVSSAAPPPGSPLPSATKAVSPGRLFRKRRLESLLIDADFAGAVVHVSGRRAPRRRPDEPRPSLAGKYGQFSAADDSGSAARLTTPNLACKVEYRDEDGRGHGRTGQRRQQQQERQQQQQQQSEENLNDSTAGGPILYGEIKIGASENTLYPSVVPLVREMLAGVKEVVSGDETAAAADAKKRRQWQRPTEAPSIVRSLSSLGVDETNSGNNNSNLLGADPSAVLGRVKLNLGLRICRQRFTLSCQPIARVSAMAAFEDVYVTFGTVLSRDRQVGNFFAVSAACRRLEAEVKHVYSRDPTGKIAVDSVALSLMNSKHVSGGGASGLSAILRVGPATASLNAKQLQDFLLFREIWYPPSPPGIPPFSTAPSSPPSLDHSNRLVQRYQQVAATAAFPWTATVAVASLDVSLDLGQAIGRPEFAVRGLWLASKKTSDWDQNLCFGVAEVAISCGGRLSGLVSLRDLRLRTSIHWPERERALCRTPLIQSSVRLEQLRVKAGFDYQLFLVADVTALEFLMYNIRTTTTADGTGSGTGSSGGGDRLVATLDGEAVQAFGTTGSAAQAVALYQVIQKLIQERRANFETSLRQIDKFIRRRSSSFYPAGSATSNYSREQPSLSSTGATAAHPRPGDKASIDDAMAKSPISLDTDVVVTLRAVNLGLFPNTFTDRQVFKMEALDARARFAATIVDRRDIHSVLALTLGQLRIGLAAVREDQRSLPAPPRRPDSSSSSTNGGDNGDVGAAAAAAATANATAAAADSGSRSHPLTREGGVGGFDDGGLLSVDAVIARATGSRGGTILKVPRVHAAMQTWQELPRASRIRYLFRSAFEGKVEVGWNYSRISYIRGMWANHTKMLEQTWGRVLAPMTSIRVTGVPEAAERGSGGGVDEEGEDASQEEGAREKKNKQDQHKITAEVNVPQSRYEYVPLEPPVIETPQLRDMGEATPPLEWIGLHRDRLPNLTHQIVIVALLELAGEVEDAYSRILGSS